MIGLRGRVAARLLEDAPGRAVVAHVFEELIVDVPLLVLAEPFELFGAERLEDALRILRIFCEECYALIVGELGIDR